MKNYIVYFILLLTLVLTGACNNEWVEEVYVQNVGLKAPVNSKGVTDVYLRYQANGEVTYRLPVIVGGSTMNERDLDVAIDVDPDTLIGLNEARWKQREDLYFQLLDKKHYEFASPTCHIPAGECQGLFDIKFKFSGLDLVDKWVLPLTILDSDSYDPNPRKNYRKALLRVMPFNDYSGAYGAANMFVYMMDNTSAMVSSTRTLHVVSENQCFFYAGVISEELKDRDKYKIVLTFNENGTLTAEPADPTNAMNFRLIGDAPTYTTSMSLDEVTPYLEHHFTTIYMSYTYDDVTTYEDKDIVVPCRAEGSMLMERKVNSLIPDTDQAIQW